MPEKKRKREGAIENVAVKISSQPAGVAMLSTEIPQDASFKVYAKKTGECLVKGQSSTFQYDGESERSMGSYAVASYNPDTNEVEIFPASVVKVESTVKAKNRQDLEHRIKQANVRNSELRTALGEAFGTKKAKKAISDMERNRIDASRLEDIEGAIVDTVMTSTESLPTQEERAKAQSEERPIPPYNLETSQVDEVYPVEGIIPKHEMAAIRVGAIAKEPTVEKRQALLPHKSSHYIAAKLAGLEKGVGEQQEKLKLIYYASLLLAVYENRRQSNRLALAAKLGNPPEVLVGGILDRFAVNKAGQFGRSKDRSFAIDPAHEHKMLCYFLALALRLDNYVLEVAPLANELSMKPSKLQELLKALGCSIKPATSAQAEALNLPGGAAAGHKLATLSAPLRLPEVAKRKRR
uniref:ARAD1B22308p n=1 Tax=Blastobotrys adeninivorans TaxID=409370 RepID=A0A060T7S5_BLAAD